MIVGFKLKKILAETLVDASSQEKNKDIRITKVNTKTDIIDISEQKIEIKDQEALDVGFSFQIDYEPKIAKVVFEGRIISLVEKNQAKKIIDDWKKKQLPKEFRLEVMNTVLSRCSIKALEIEEDIGLPPHFPLPRFQVQEKGQENKAQEKPKDNSNTRYAG